MRLAGCIAALISCPAEMTLVRLSNDATLPPQNVRALFTCLKCAYHDRVFGPISLRICLPKT